MRMWSEDAEAVSAMTATTTTTNMVDDKNSNDGRMQLLLAATEMRTDAAEPKKVGRDRSMSVPCRPTPSGMSSEVETVVIKAKRASSYLWMLLHSQVCILSCIQPAWTAAAPTIGLHVFLSS